MSLVACMCVCACVWRCMYVCCGCCSRKYVGARAPHVGEASLFPACALFANTNRAPLEGRTHASNQAKTHTFTLVGFNVGVPGSVVVVPTPADPAGIRRCARDVRTWSAAKKNHTDEERGGRRDPGVRRPSAGRSQLSALSRLASCHR